MAQTVAQLTTYMTTKATEIGLRLGLTDLRDADPQTRAVVTSVLAMDAVIIYALNAKNLVTEAELSAVLDLAMSQLPPIPPNIVWP